MKSDGKISQRFIDSKTNEEWFVVKYGDNKTKKMQRFCSDLRIKNMDMTLTDLTRMDDMVLIRFEFYFLFFEQN